MNAPIIVTTQRKMTHNYKSMIRAALGGLILTALGACSSAPARDADTYYDLRPEIAAVSFGSEKTLKLQSVSVKGLQSGRSLVFQADSNPVQYQEVRGHLWHVAPSSLIETATAQALISASQDLIIGTSDTVDNEDYRLKIAVSQFHFVPNDKAIVVFDAVLKDRRGKIISSSRHNVSKPLSGSDYQSAVLGLEEALRAAIADMSAKIAAAL